LLCRLHCQSKWQARCDLSPDCSRPTGANRGH
jgi:hypothetical protein